MPILGISSATKIISIGLLEDSKVLVETTLAEIHSEKLMFYIKKAGIMPEQIEAVAVASGPGSYSGLRGGLATAKSLAQTLNIPLVGVSTLEAAAYNLVNIEGTMAVVLNARSDEYNFALFGASGGKLKRLTEDFVINLDNLLDKLNRISGNLYLIGDLGELEGKVDGKNFHFTDELHSHPYGINVAKLGLIRLKAGEKDDFLELVPQYSHSPNIREFKK